MIVRPLIAATALLLAAPAIAAKPLSAQAAEVSFRTLYKGLVETNTTLSAGSCTKAARLAADHLAAAGMARENLHILVAPGHPDEGNLVAVFPGRDGKAKASTLMLAHLDVVEARREDWVRDPFTLIEEDGWFYARGAADAKSLAAIWVDTLARLARDGTRPRRTLKLALTCGEETNGAFNGAQWLAAEHRDLIDADFALNEGGGGKADENGLVVAQTVQVGEKTFANFELVATNPGGHSASPRPDNAIYDLSRAVLAVEAHRFPVEFTAVTRKALQARTMVEKSALAAAIAALLADPADAAADAVVASDPNLRSNTRTTCVATMLAAGHARNALAQKASANVNCRIFPGHSIEEIRAELAQAIGNPAITVTTLAPIRPAPPAPVLTPAVMRPMMAVSARHFPGVTLGASMANGYTDSTFLTAAGIPAFGVPGIWTGPEESGVHGLNERIRVKALFDGRAYLHDLIRAYGG